MTVPFYEHRREPRHPAQGAVRIWWADPQPVQVEGRLIDVSENGFRMAHQYFALRAGQPVEFAHAIAKGKARTVWTRITEEGVQSGFVVVS